MPKICHENILRLRKGEELLFRILHTIMEVIFSRLIFISATSPLVLCTYKFVLNLFLFIIIFFFLQTRVATNSIN